MKPNYDTEKYMLQREVADLFNIKQYTLTKALQRGTIDAKRLGPVTQHGQWKLYDREKVLEYFRSDDLLKTRYTDSAVIVEEFEWFINFMKPWQAIKHLCDLYGREARPFIHNHRDKLLSICHKKGLNTDVKDLQRLV